MVNLCRPTIAMRAGVSFCGQIPRAPCLPLGGLVRRLPHHRSRHAEHLRRWSTLGCGGHLWRHQRPLLHASWAARRCPRGRQGCGHWISRVHQLVRHLCLHTGCPPEVNLIFNYVVLVKCPGQAQATNTIIIQFSIVYILEEECGVLEAELHWARFL